MAIRYSFILCLLAIFLNACAPQEMLSTPTAVSLPPLVAVTLVSTRPTTPPTPQPDTPTPTALPAETALPATNTAVPTTPFPMFTRTSIPTRTPLPPSATPSPFLDLPAWVNNPETAVLAAFTSQEYDEASTGYLLNVDSGERFELPDDIQDYRFAWGQDEKGAYFRYDTDAAYQQVYLADGAIVQMAEPQGQLGDVSPNGRYLSTYVAVENSLGYEVVITDLQTQETVIAEDPFNGRYPYFFAYWSPGSDLLLVNRHENEAFIFSGGYGLIIYNEKGQIFSQYDGLWFTAWDPDNSHRLLTRQTTSTSDLPSQVYGTVARCIVNIQDGHTDCLPEITTWQEENGVSIENYQWLPTADGISFMYWWQDEENISIGLAGFCTFTLATRQVNCPFDQETWSIPSYDPLYIHDYDWSPDGRYLWLELDYYSPGSDVSNSQIAIIGSDGSQYQLLGWGHDVFWRPAIAP